MIEHLSLKRINALYAEEIHEAVNRVVDSGWYLRGDATARFEQDYARYIGTWRRAMRSSCQPTPT